MNAVHEEHTDTDVGRRGIELGPAKPPEEAVEISAEPAKAAEVRARKPRRRWFSTLTLRILTPNVVALAVLLVGLLYFDRYRDGLLDAKVAALQTQAEMIAAALGENAVLGPPEKRELDHERALAIIGRLAATAKLRARLFNPAGLLIADSRESAGARRQVLLRYLPPGEDGDRTTAVFNSFYDWLMPRLPRGQRFPPYRERWAQHANDYGEAASALTGEIGGAIRTGPNNNLVITVAAPVQELRQVVGAVMLSTDSADVDQAVRTARGAVAAAFALALAATVLLSIFLAGTIERPLRHLAQAADRVRLWRSRRAEIPDLGRRRDEIGDLSEALRDMTSALYARLDEIEAFAADVSHEIKNPLTSIRSALDALPLTANEDQRQHLFEVMASDVGRLDRLISDISSASRVDAELSRAELEPVDLAALLETAVDIYRTRLAGEGGPAIVLDLPPGKAVVIEGIGGRLGQVVDNLLANAVSFSPPGGTITVGLAREDGTVRITIEDEGPGVPAGEHERVFARFYSKRPAAEAFGQHSGLGLSIARQIVSAHGGEITCENRLARLGPALGARFVLLLPLN